MCMYIYCIGNTYIFGVISGLYYSTNSVCPKVVAKSLVKKLQKDEGGGGSMLLLSKKSGHAITGAFLMITI